MTPCQVDGCVHHDPACLRDDSCSCGPALALPRSQVCAHHETSTREDLRQLPELWEALAEQPRSTPGGTGRDELDAAAPVDPDAVTLPAVLEARHVIRWTLVSWCKILAEPGPFGRGVTLPDERVIARNTRLDVLRAQWDADIALQAFRDGLGLLDAHYRLRGEADRLRAWRASGRDVLEALAEHVDRHLAWLLASEHAPVLVAEVRAAARARTLVWPARHALSIACSTPACQATGVRVALDVDPGDPNQTFHCRGCGEWGTAKWWQAREAPPSPGLLPLTALPDWLFSHARLVVTLKQLRHWADRDVIIPVVASARRADGTIGPARFDPHQVAVTATARLTRGTRSA